MLLILFNSHFLCSRCMLELKFAINHREASLSKQYCSIGWRIIDQALFKHWVNNGWQRLSRGVSLPRSWLRLQVKTFFWRLTVDYTDFQGFDHWLHWISTVDYWLRAQLRKYGEECIVTPPLPVYGSRCVVAAVTIESMGVTPLDSPCLNA